MGLDVPLFSRLLNAGMESQLLDIQYRMHPAIAQFPSLRFYAGKVHSGVGEQERPPVQVGMPALGPGMGGRPREAQA